MALSQYKNTFQQNMVTGEMMAQFDEETLEKKYKMSTSFHRKKLMRVISGALNVETYFS